MEKEKIQKIAKTVVIAIVIGFGFWILSFGFRLIWEVVKSIYLNW